MTMRRGSTLAGLLVLPLLLQGCLLFVGAAIALGVVHVAGEDTTEVTLETSWDVLYAHCEAELKARGNVSSGDRSNGKLDAHVGGSEVHVSLEKATEHAIKVVVKARKNSGISPDLDTAQQISYAIVKRTGG